METVSQRALFEATARETRPIFDRRTRPILSPSSRVSSIYNETLTAVLTLVVYVELLTHQIAYQDILHLWIFFYFFKDSSI